MKLFGKRSVLERLKANPQTIARILIEKKFSDEEVLKLARKKKIMIERLDDRRFYRMSHGMNSQGIMADVGEYDYEDFDDMVSLEDKDKPVLVFLDGVTDPQNLGSIIRTLACLGGFCIVLPKRDSVGMNETVLRVASGGENYVPVCQISNLSNSLQRAKKEGYFIGATAVEGGVIPREVSLKFPLGLILGSEGQGMRPILEKYVDYKFTIPMEGSDLSFNVAIATAILGYEVACQSVSV
jgi:23S rRNA (guanosine2251-2'-O)-methyltransferase